MSEKTKLLFVIDMQNDFINGVLGTTEAQQIVPNVVEKIKNFNGRIIVTKDTHEKNYLSTQEGKNLPVEHCIMNTKGWEINSDVMTVLEEKDSSGGDNIYIHKPSFGFDSWKEILHVEEFGGYTGENIESIELIGLCTDICVISNAMILKAMYPEIPITVDSSCCAGVTPQSHSNALEAMKMCQINII